MNWKISYIISNESFAPLQKGNLTNLRLKNLSDKRMVVTDVLLRFDWQGTYRYVKQCNIKIGPKKSSNLPDMSFMIELSASPGSHNFKPGISYMLLEDDEWKKYTEEYDSQGEFIEIQPLPKKDFTVFVSHSNNFKDSKIVSQCKAAMESCGITGYFAEDDSSPGTILWNKIHSKIDISDAFLILWTKDASNSGDVREEIGIAFGLGKKKIIPIVEKGVSVQGSLKTLGIEWINYEPPNHQHAISDALSLLMNEAIEKEKKKSIVLQSPKKKRTSTKKSSLTEK
jgi:hypothetical protein